MAPHNFWKGYLKLSLVTCPVAMMPATTEAEKLRFHTLNRATGNRLEQRYVDAGTGDEVPDDDAVRGYERDSGSMVILEEDELRQVALESTRTIDIDSFVPRGTIEWIWLDRAHYLTPDDAVGEEAFCVIREAMASAGVVGISRLVLYRRERAVMLEPCGRGIIVWTLRYGDEVRPAANYQAGADAKASPADMLELLVGLIDRRMRDWDPALVRDPVQENLQSLIAAKKKGRRVAAKPKAPAPAGNVVSIMDALKRSIAADQADGRRAKKAPARRH